MPIYAPGHRDRNNRPKRKGGRSAIAMLSLTAMVDMFTVLVVFLLQNYNVTGEVIELEDSVELPKAAAVKELKPAHVIVVSKQNVLLDSEIVLPTADLRETEGLMIERLRQALADAFVEDAKKTAVPGLNTVKNTVDDAKNAEEDNRRITVQADKTIDFLSIKKVMETVQEAGASEINFAVIKTEGGAPATAAE